MEMETAAATATAERQARWLAEREKSWDHAMRAIAHQRELAEIEEMLDSADESVRADGLRRARKW